jgi:conflict system STAND superfamily ATPase
MNTAAGPPSPYKGLVPYDEADAPFFFGREREREIIGANLLSSRLTLLYGPSGVGKSSVLRAGVVSHLRQVAVQDAPPDGIPEFVIVLFDAWRDPPIPQLAMRVVDTVTGTQSERGRLNLPAECSFAELLERCTSALDREILIVLDQFEEYFLYHSGEDGAGTLLTELPRAVNRHDLRVNFLISIREDALAKLDAFKGRVPNLFDNYLRIDHLGCDAARSAIERPIDEYNSRLPPGTPEFSVEPALVDAVLRQVQTGRVLFDDAGRGGVRHGGPTGSAGASVETPYLQLVMTRLWNQEVDAGSRVLRLETLTELGGAERIVKTHLDAAMSTLSDADQTIAAAVFRFLVTPSGAKITYTARDLAEYVDLDEPQLVPILERLAMGDVRILRAVAPPTDGPAAMRYQIFHDVLAPAILDWRTRFTRARDLAEAERRSDEDRIVRVLGGRIWSAVKLTGTGGLVLTAIVTAALLSDPESNASSLPQWLTAAGLVAAILILWAGQPQSWFRIWRATRQALRLGFRWPNVLELLSDPRGDTAALIAGAGEYAVVDQRTRSRMRRARVVTAILAWLSAAVLPIALLIALALGGRHIVGITGVVEVALVPSSILLVLALLSYVSQAAWLRAARSSNSAGERHRNTGLTGKSSARWPTSRGTLPTGVAPQPLIAWRMRLVFWLGVLWIAASGAAAALDALIAGVPLIESGVGAGFETLYMTAGNRARQVDIGHRYRVPIDPAVSPLDAGRALYSLSEAGATGELIGALPVPRRLPSWVRDINPTPFKENWAALVPRLLSHASEGFSAEERRYLERIASHPGLVEYATVARAADIDWLGARLPYPLPKELTVATLGGWLPSYRSLGLASDVQIARAALLLSDKRLVDAERAVREVISFGLVLLDSSTAAIDVLTGTAIAKKGLDNLETFYGTTGRRVDADMLRDARLSTAPSGDATDRRPSRSEARLDNGRARAALMSNLQDTKQLRGLRWEELFHAAITPCSNSRELLFGPSDAIRAGLERARHDLVHSRQEAALFDLVSSSPLVPDDMTLAPGLEVLFRVVRLAESVLGRRGIAQCLVLPALAGIAG